MKPDDIHNTEATHFIVDLYDVEDFNLLDNMIFCETTVKKACEIAGCGVLNLYKHKFHPQGISINLTLSESHCAIHTWPERGYCAIDLYGCGNVNLKAGIDFLIKMFKPKKKRIIELLRGHEHDVEI